MALLIANSGCGVKVPFGRTSVAPFRAYQAPESTGEITATFMGTTSVLFQDGETSILSDGFVSRPGRFSVAFRRIGPDSARIQHALERLRARSIAAIFAGHSHYDHAMDAPVFAQRTGAVLLGSESTANVGRGMCLPPEQIRVVQDGDTVSFGRFQLTFVKSHHSAPELFSGPITTPFTPPARARQWKSDTSWSVFIRNGDRTLLVHGSANYRCGALRGRHADVVYLGIGGLGRQSDAFIETYWNEVVRATGARRVILVHWDDFFRGLEKPLRPLSSSFKNAMRHILRLAKEDNVDVVLPVAWQRMDPFANLRGDAVSGQVRTSRPASLTFAVIGDTGTGKTGQHDVAPALRRVAAVWRLSISRELVR